MTLPSISPWGRRPLGTILPNVILVLGFFWGNLILGEFPLGKRLGDDFAISINLHGFAIYRLRIKRRSQKAMGSKRKSSDENGDGEASPTRSGGSKRHRRDWVYTLDEFMKKLNPRELQQVQKLCQKYGINAPELSSRDCEYRFQFKNEFPDILYTETNFKAEIVLVDALNNVISSGPMATCKIEIVVLEGFIDIDENGKWTEEQFKNYVLEPRKDKGPLLIGNLPTKLCNGIGIISDAKFTDCSFWSKSKTFRLGVRGMAKQVQEGISKDFRVLNRHMKELQKDHPPSMNDEVYHLKGISKDGPLCRKLVECQINTVRDFLYYCNKHGPEMLRDMIGMKKGNWEKAYGHALKSIERPDILLDGCLVNPPAQPDQFQKIFQKYDMNAPELSSRECEYRYQFKNEFPGILYTETNFKAEIVLVDASNNIISSGPMATGKIEIVVLNGDIDVDENGEWTEEQFKNFVLEPRKGKGPLLIGNLSTRLCDGIGSISDARFTDNSSWTKPKTFRLGVRGMAKQVQEGISKHFRVLDRHMKGLQKDHPPSVNDEVYRLKGISKGGPFHKKLVECQINTVRDLLCYCINNGPETLRDMIGMKESNWKKAYCQAIQSWDRLGYLPEICLVHTHAADQNLCELNGSSSSQNVPVQHNGMVTSAQGLSAPIGSELGIGLGSILIMNKAICEPTVQNSIPFKNQLEENERSCQPDKFQNFL